MAKIKITPFARLLMFLLIFLPVAYFGASYYNGEDPVANIKNVLGTDDVPAQEQVDNRSGTSPSTPPATFQNVRDLRNEVKELKKSLAIAEEQLARCQTENVE